MLDFDGPLACVCKLLYQLPTHVLMCLTNQKRHGHRQTEKKNIRNFFVDCLKFPTISINLLVTSRLDSYVPAKCANTLVYLHSKPSPCSRRHQKLRIYRHTEHNELLPNVQLERASKSPLKCPKHAK